MSTPRTDTLSVPIRSLGARAVATAAAVVAAVALPQLVHAIGTMSGTGPALAQALLPMYLPVMVVGLLAGPEVGVVVGVLSPLVSFGLTGMPAPALLPMMITQLAVSGLVAGLVCRLRVPSIGKALLVVVAGNAAVLVVALVGTLFPGVAWVPAPAAWWTALAAGWPGIAIELVVLPLVAAWARRLV